MSDRYFIRIDFGAEYGFGISVFNPFNSGFTLHIVLPFFTINISPFYSGYVFTNHYKISKEYKRQCKAYIKSLKEV